MKKIEVFMVVFINKDDYVITKKLDDDLLSLSDQEIKEKLSFIPENFIILRPEDDLSSTRSKINTLLDISTLNHFNQSYIDEMHAFKEETFVLKNIFDLEEHKIFLSKKDDYTFSGRKKTYRDFKSQFKI